MPQADTASSDDASPSQDARAIPGSVWALAAFALALRLAAVFVLRRFDDSTAMEHASLARHLLLGDGFSFGDWGHYGASSVQSPPYPLLLAGLFKLFGTDTPAAYAGAQCINALAGAAMVPLVYLLVRTVGGHRVVGMIAAAMMAVWPTQILAVASVQAIALITLCTSAIVVLWYRSLDTGRLGPWVGFGLIGCLGALTEPVLLPPMALCGVLILAQRELPMSLRLRNAAVLLACAVVVIGPWTWRNYRVHGTFMPIKSSFWVNVWKGNNPNDPSGTDRPALSPARLAAFKERGIDDARQYDLLSPEQVAELRGTNDAQREEIFKKYATTFIEGNPRGYTERCVRRLGKTLFGDWDHPLGRKGGIVYFGSRGLLLIGSVTGLALAIRRRWRIGLAGMIVALSLLTYTLTITAARFALPLEPFQIALTALAVAWIGSRRVPKLRAAMERQPRYGGLS